jgi:hypothetical protein
VNDLSQSTIVLPSADQIVKQYIELRDYKKHLAEKHAAELKPYNDAMAALAGAADLLMKETRQTALKTAHGTAFPVKSLSVTCSDQVAFLDFVFQHNARQFLTAHVAKEAVEQYMDGPGAGHPPPGVIVTPVVNINFRKA